MSKTKFFLATLAQALAGFVLLPSIAMAVGFGNLSVNSKLGEPLNLEVELLSITPTEIGTLTVTLASRADFARANIAYPENTSQLTFELVEGIDGQYFVEITSLNPVNETFLHFMLVANWSGGKVVREFTALMDPPLYSGEPGSAVQAPTTLALEPDSSTEADSSAMTTDTSGSGYSSSQSTVVVVKGDTLSGIVKRLGLPDSVSMYQGLTSLLEANPDAFVNGNMNRLKAGATLTVPEFERIAQVDSQTALRNFQSQVNEYNQYLTGIGYIPEAEPAPVESGDSGQQVAETEQPVQTEEAEAVTAMPGPEEESKDLSDLEGTIGTVEDDVARLSIGQEAGETSDIGAVEGQQGEEEQIEALKAQLAELDESLLASGVENQEVKNRLKAIQEQVDRVSALIEIEDSALALAQDQSSDTSENTSESGNDSDQAVAVIDQTGQVDDGGESGVADAASSEEDIVSAADIVSAEESATDESAVTTATVAIASTETQPTAAATTAIATTATASNTATESSQVETVTTANTEQPAQQPEAAAPPQQESKAEPASSPTRTVANSGIMANLSNIFGSISDYALKVVAALVVLIAGLFFYRRRKSQQEFEESMLDIESEQLSTNVERDSFKQLSGDSGVDLASGDSGFELTIGGGMSYLTEEGIAGVAEEENEVVQAGAVDPLAEADVYLAYDRDEQAIQVLKEAYAMNPERVELAEKLLEIYHKQDDRVAFDDLAMDLRRRIGAKHHPVWTKVSAMGREVSPENERYKDSSGLQEDSDSAIELDSTPQSADITFLDDADTKRDDASQVEIVSLDVDELDLGSGQSEQTAIKSLELDDLDLKLGGEVDEGDRALDAPTLSQIITAAEAQDGVTDAQEAGVIEKAEAPPAEQPILDDTDDGAVEFNLGDADDDSDEIADLDESSELAHALKQLEIGMEDIEQAVSVEDEVAELNVLAEELGSEDAVQIEEVAETATAAENIMAEEDSELSEDSSQSEEDSYLSDLSEQSISRQEPYHESETALELAKAYLELGEKDIAKGFIEEVINDGSDKQKARAEKLVKELVE